MQINGIEYTIGADPEVFVCNKAGMFQSAHNLVPGTKRKPHKVMHGAVQVDGMALEFNIDPASSLEEFHNNISDVMSTLQGMIGDLGIMQKASVHFDEKLFASVPAYNRVMGCEGDFNGWSMSQNRSPDADKLMRTAGGHVHIGGFFTKSPFIMQHFEKSARLARILDEELGIPSLFWDDDDERREMYGKAGCFRPKKYGMEYRTLSNKWIFDKALIEKVYKGCERALHKFSDESYEPSVDVQDIINQSDRTYASKFLEKRAA